MTLPLQTLVPPLHICLPESCLLCSNADWVHKLAGSSDSCLPLPDCSPFSRAVLSLMVFTGIKSWNMPVPSQLQFPPPWDFSRGWTWPSDWVWRDLQVLTLLSVRWPCVVLGCAPDKCCSLCFFSLALYQSIRFLLQLLTQFIKILIRAAYAAKESGSIWKMSHEEPLQFPVHAYGTKKHLTALRQTHGCAVGAVLCSVE